MSSPYFSLNQFISLSPYPEETKSYFNAASRWIVFPDEANGIFVVANRLTQVLEVVRGIDAALYRHLSPLSTWANHIRELSVSHRWKDSPDLQQKISPFYSLEHAQIKEQSAAVWMMLSVDHSTIMHADRQRFFLYLNAFTLVSTILLGDMGNKFDQVYLSIYLVNRSIGLMLLIPHPDHQRYLARGDGEITLETIRGWLEWLSERLEDDDELSDWCRYASFSINVSVESASGVPPEIFFHHWHRKEKELLWNLSQYGVGYGHSIHLVSDILEAHDEESVENLAEEPDGRMVDEGVELSELKMVTECWVSLDDDNKIAVSNWSPDVYMAFYQCQEPERKPNLYDDKSIATSYLRARAAARRQLINKQYLTTRLTRPTATTVGNILGVMDHLYQAGSAELKETLLLFAVSITTGVHPRSLVRLPIFSGVDEFASSGCRVAYVPSLEIFLRRDNAPGKNNSDEIFQIGDFLRLGRLFDISQSKLFVKRQEEYLLAYQSIVIRAFSKAEIDRHWIKSYSLQHLLLKHFIGVEEANRLKAMTLFGVPSDSDMGRVYTAFDLHDLNHYYYEGLRGLYARMVRNGYQEKGQGLFQWGSMEPILQNISQTSVGSRLLPDLSKLRKVIALLQDKLSVAVMDSDSKRIQYHNDLTTYVALILSLTTAFRAVRTPIFNLLLIDPDTGMMQLQEKDRKDHAHARVAFIPTNVRSLINYYLSHLRRLTYSFPYEWSGVIEIPSTKHRDRAIAKQFNLDDSFYSLALNRNMFFLDAGNKKNPIDEVTGYTLRKNINQLVWEAWPADNSNRHWVRSYLQERGCSETVIYAFMGHWDNDGEEYWGMTSAMDPLLYRDHIAPHIEQLLAEVGYDPMKVIQQ